MANWNILKSAIAETIKTNGNQEITGQLLQNVLNNIVTSVGENATFAGIATPTTNPGAPDGPVFYLASTPGTYNNFAGAVIASGISVLEWKNSSWVKHVFFSIDDKPIAGSENLVKSGGVKEELDKLGAEIGNIVLQDEIRGYIQKSTGVWMLYENSGHYRIDATYLKGRKITIVANPNKDTCFGFVVKSNKVQGESPEWCNGFDFLNDSVVPAGQYREVLVPDDCNYIYIYGHYEDTIFAPEIIKSGIAADIVIIDKEIENINEEIVTQKQDISEIEEDIISVKNRNKEDVSFRVGEFIFHSSDDINKSIDDNKTPNEWRKSYYCQLIKTSAGKKYKIIPKPGNYTTYCFLTTDSMVSGQMPDFAEGYDKAIRLGGETTVVAPENAQYLYVYLGDEDRHRMPKMFLVDEELKASDIISVIDVKESSIQSLATLDANGNIVDFSGTDTTSKMLIKQYDVEEGKNYYVTARVANNNTDRIPWAFYDTGGNCIEKGPAGTTSNVASVYKNHKITAPSGATQIKVTSNANIIIPELKAEGNLQEYLNDLNDSKIPTPYIHNVLIIGNSWARDTATELWSVANDIGISMKVCQAYQGGSSLYNMYKGMDNALLHYTHGSYEQYVQGTYQLWEYNDNDAVKTPSSYNNGKCGIYDGTAWGKKEDGTWAGHTLQEILKMYDWDIILITLHCGELQNIASLTENDDNLKFFDINNFINRLERELSESCRSKVKWGITNSWSYPEEAALTYTPKQSILNGLGIEDWKSLSVEEKKRYYSLLYPNMQMNTQLVAKHIGNKLSYVVNTCKALQYARKSYWLGDVAWHMIRSSTDTHLGNGIPKYICALTVIYSIFDRLKNNLKLDYIPDLKDSSGDNSDGGNESNPSIPTTALCIGANNVSWKASMDWYED